MFKKLRVYFLLVGIIVGCLGIIRVIEYSISNRSSIISYENMDVKDIQYLVEISGAVKRPGIYSMIAGSRIYELIDNAGGLSEDINLKEYDRKINKVRLLVDGEKVYIPFVGESLEVPDLINVNTASQKELESLSGVGSVTAKKIIDARPYIEIEDLIVNKIITISTYEKIKDKIVI